jgi:putative intracellular protease/amidase
METEKKVQWTEVLLKGCIDKTTVKSYNFEVMIDGDVGNFWIPKKLVKEAGPQHYTIRIKPGFTTPYWDAAKRALTKIGFEELKQICEKSMEKPLPK